MDTNDIISGVRELLQDVIAPDLKALAVRMDGLEKRMDGLEKTIAQGFRDVNERISDLIRFNELEKRMSMIETKQRKEGTV